MITKTPLSESRKYNGDFRHLNVTKLVTLDRFF